MPVVKPRPKFGRGRGSGRGRGKKARQLYKWDSAISQIVRLCDRKCFGD